MKKVTTVLSILLIVLVVVSSCKKDDENPDVRPKITDVVAANHDGGTEVSLGGTISVDFEVITQSDAKLWYYNIEIHDHPASGAIEDEYKIIDDQFTDNFQGLINAHVHKHIQVPDTANLGSYHVVVIVVDEDGNSSDTEALETHIEIVQ